MHLSASALIAPQTIPSSRDRSFYRQPSIANTAQQSAISPAQRNKTHSSCRSSRGNAIKNRQTCRDPLCLRAYSAARCVQSERIHLYVPGLKQVHNHKQQQLASDARRTCLFFQLNKMHHHYSSLRLLSLSYGRRDSCVNATYG